MVRAWTLVVALALLAPPALGWRTPDPEAAQPGAPLQAWALAWGRSTLVKAADPAAKARADVACPMGDADGDGHGDLLVHARAKGGKAEARALAGPAFERVVWARSHEGRAQLSCAPDLEGDGVGDPILAELEDATPPASALPLPQLLAANEATGSVLALDGATGAPLVELEARASERGARTDAATGATDAATTLDPAGPELLLHVKLETTVVSLDVAVLGQGVTVERGTTTIEVVDAAGEVVGSIEAADPQSELLAYAAVPDLEETRVIVLSAVEASPFDEAPARVPTASAYDAAGALLWTLELPTTYGIPVLLPQAGDLDGDGVIDLIVETLPADVSASPGASLTVLSGADGAVLLDERVDAGVVMALPFGDVAGAFESVGDAVLVVRQAATDAPLAIEQVLESGVAWSVEVPASAAPVNAVLDPFTGDISGFTDLTGDAIPDVALLFAGDAHVEVLSGRDGSLAWSEPVHDGAQVVPVPDADGGSDLLVVGRDGDALDVRRLDGGTGKTQWDATGPAPPGGDEVDVQTEPLVGDGTDDVLVTTRGQDGPEGEGDVPRSVYVLDGATGETRWTSSADDGTAPPPPLESTEAPGRSGPGDARVPTAALVLAAGVAIAVGGGALALRRLRPG